MGRKWSKEERAARGKLMRSVWHDRNSKFRKLDHEQIVHDYESGLTMPEVAKKNSCSERQVFRILKAAGKSRGWLESKLFKKYGWKVGWRRLYGSRSIPVPGALVRKAGLDLTETIWAKWELAGKNELKLVLRNRRD